MQAPFPGATTVPGSTAQAARGGRLFGCLALLVRGGWYAREAVLGIRPLGFLGLFGFWPPATGMRKGRLALEAGQALGLGLSGSGAMLWYGMPAGLTVTVGRGGIGPLEAGGRWGWVAGGDRGSD